ncbi:hypothetical protein EPI10_021366 [Gossypium australe]|uniref:Reverse transcriptase n=1 Tax=Gossypium australe TaxID=47621 RepID=A0A5B6WIN4_9ROSI|nr:hypothetical protein EPI10_021366 [Gossypium australe]
MHALKNGGKGKRERGSFALKLDMSKAYNRGEDFDKDIRQEDPLSLILFYNTHKGFFHFVESRKKRRKDARLKILCLARPQKKEGK